MVPFLATPKNKHQTGQKSISPAQSFERSPSLCGSYPYIIPSTPQTPISGHFTASNGLKTAQNDHNGCQNPLWSLHTALNTLPVTNDLQMGRFGCLENQFGSHGALGGILPTQSALWGQIQGLAVSWPPQLKLQIWKS